MLKLMYEVTVSVVIGALLVAATGALLAIGAGAAYFVFINI